jgi:hypothetical protein
MPVSILLPAAIRPDPEQARSWVERELSRPEYQRSLRERFLAWLDHLLSSLSTVSLNASPLSTAVVVLLVVGLLVLVLVVAARLRREPGAPRTDGGVLSDRGTSPDEHRASAIAALEAGDVDLALVEAFRTVASRALRRGLLDDRPGLTADELAVDLGPAFPAHADALTRAAMLFDLVFYGDQPADPADARAVLDLDEALRAARPAQRSSSEPQPTAAAPR